MNNVEKIINWAATLFIPVLLFLLAPMWGSLFEEKKAIEYSVVAEQKIFDKEEFKDGWPGFQFNNGESELSEAYLTTIKISNSGKAPIRTDDFESQIKFEIKLEKGKIKPRIAASYPKDLPVKVKAEEGELLINPLLLNPGDYFFIEIMTESKIEISRAIVRIVGMDNIKEKQVTPYFGLMLELIEPGETISSTKQRHLMPIASYGLALASLLAAFCTFLFFFAFQASRSKIIKFIFMALSSATYLTSLFSSKFLPEAYFGSSSEKWMDYISMLGILLFGATLAFWLRNKLGKITLRRAAEEQD